MVREELRSALLDLVPIKAILIRIEGNTKHIMSQVDDGIAAVKAAVTKLGGDMQAEIDGLKAEIAAGADTAPRLTALSDLVTQLQGLDATAIASTPAAATTSGATTGTTATA